jgi:hypothetical protein
MSDKKNLSLITYHLSPSAEVNFRRLWNPPARRHPLLHPEFLLGALGYALGCRRVSVVSLGRNNFRHSSNRIASALKSAGDF